MNVFFSAITSLMSLLIFVDALFFSYLQSLPDFTGSACALVSLIIASMEYRATKAKKPKNGFLRLIIIAAFLGILNAARWMWILLF